ncbi:MAG TPA: aldo/keto reductase [Bacteroidia bacterium]|nr:aldo/keto reductase [Bacteroidia bacterium]
MITRNIPSTGEPIPAIGLGTWQKFDVGHSESERKPLREVLKLMTAHSAKMIDTSPMYAKSEQVIGELTSELDIADKFFYATKVWITGRKEGIRQMTASMQKLKRSQMDLMQVHNLVDWQTHLETLKQWKQEGRIRYTGVTHYTASAHEQLEKIIISAKPDFVQFNYSIRERNAEHRLLDTAKDNGVAVIINEPLEKGTLFSAVKGKPLPQWAAEYSIHSWAQFFLKYILSHPAVTGIITGTGNPANMKDNLSAGIGMLPGEKTRAKMVEVMKE